MYHADKLGSWAEILRYIQSGIRSVFLSQLCHMAKSYVYLSLYILPTLFPSNLAVVTGGCTYIVRNETFTQDIFVLQNVVI